MDCEVGDGGPEFSSLGECAGGGLKEDLRMLDRE